MLYEYLKTRTTEYLPLFNRPMPRIQIKQYKGRWGSCYDQLNLVTFNFSLVYLDKELIDYVDTMNLGVEKPITLIDNPTTKPDRRPKKRKM